MRLEIVLITALNPLNRLFFDMMAIFETIIQLLIYTIMENIENIKHQTLNLIRFINKTSSEVENKLFSSTDEKEKNVLAGMYKAYRDVQKQVPQSVISFAISPKEKPKKWIQQDGDYDYNHSYRMIFGNLTPERIKKIASICEANTWQSHCGHEYDCCGCMCSQRIEFKKVSNNMGIVLLWQSFNY